MTFAPPPPTRALSLSQDSPTSTRSRRIAILPPSRQPSPPASPPVPARSPLRPTPRPPADTPAPRPDAVFSKRKHALNELLSSERAYASDLALIRDIHIPLALGLPAPFLAPTAPGSPPPPPSPQVPPMTKEDTRAIFGNVEELAVFSEVFCEKLEEALHGVLDPDGDGQDRVGELFLSMIPHMKPPYTTYITRHPSAVAHLNALPQTPALTAYLAQTHTLAQSYTHAWDLPSLLIKPVQRLLKYPLLLAAIMDDTQPGDAKDKLREARDKVEEVARGVNEGRRRWDVVKTLLDGKHPPPVRLKSIKGLKHMRNASKDDQGQLDSLEKRLRTSESFVQDFAKDIVDWSLSLRDTLAHLERWSTTFGRVIGLGQPHGSEALDLFTSIVSTQITPIFLSLDTAIQSTLLPKLARLLTTTAQPLLLLEHMHALRPQHLALLDAPISKARPAPALLDASQSYLALDAQLRAELPRYLLLLERGLTACLCQLADWQARFWREVRAQWVELWDALGVEGDMAAGAVDTVRVWWERWEEVDTLAGALGITKPRRESRMSRTSRTSVGTSASGHTHAHAHTPQSAGFVVAEPGSYGEFEGRRGCGGVGVGEGRVRAAISCALPPRGKSTTSGPPSPYPPLPPQPPRPPPHPHPHPPPPTDAASSRKQAQTRRRTTHTTHSPPRASRSTPPPPLRLPHGEHARGRVGKKPSMRKRFADAFRSPSKRPPSRSHTRPYTPTTPHTPNTPSTSPYTPSTPSTPPYTPSTPLYTCTAIHPFSLPPTLLYRSLPFLTLLPGDTVTVLAEEGHPREHAELPIRPEDEECEDCLLLVRGGEGEMGWALASFLVVGG
ncbi:hypothetical protein K439DRAFT_1334343 [Ramaria rubella]|nr:hypothetical protein K439DRAFT_1334343 [Ramaria rubella]